MAIRWESVQVVCNLRKGRVLYAQYIRTHVGENEAVTSSP